MIETTRIEFDIDMWGNTVTEEVDVTYYDDEWWDFDD